MPETKDKAPTADEILEIIGRIVAKAKEEAQRAIDKVPPSLRGDMAAHSEEFFAKIAANITEAFKPEILAAVAARVAKTLRDGRGPTRKNPGALA